MSADSRKTTVERLTEGWLIGGASDSPDARAHFYRNGHSACHRWTSTTLDRTARPGDPQCIECREAFE